MTILQQFFNDHPDLAHEMVQKSNHMLMLSDATGRVLWANDAFCNFIGYSLAEFLRQDNPVTWLDFTLKDASLEADVEQVQHVEAGDIVNYKIRKYYIPKNAAPIPVELYVRKFPPTRKNHLEFFMVDIIKMGPDSHGVLKSYEDIAKETSSSIGRMADKMHELSESVSTMNSLTVNGLIQYFTHYPKVSLIVITIILGLILGPRFFEIIHEAINLFKSP